jgi:arthrofactin-type cyclic lipopeptide synthetase C
VTSSLEDTTIWAGIEALNAEERTNSPLTLSVDDLGDGFSLKAQSISRHEAGTLDPARICLFMQTALARLVDALETAPTTSVSAIDVMPPAERRLLLAEWNSTTTDFPRESCVHQLFEAQAARNPLAVALEHHQRRLNYGQLNILANRLAHRLLDLGVRPETSVALLLPRSIGLVAAQLAVLKCGAAYVPIDPAAPAQRLTFMAADCQARVIITTGKMTLPDALSLPRLEIDDLDLLADHSSLPATDGLNPIDDDHSHPTATGESNLIVADHPNLLAAANDHSARNLNLPISSATTAYVMYTSGSTGTPKGVMVTHRAIGRLVLNCGYADFNSSDRVAFAANPAFDASTMEVWAPLLNGGRIVVIDREAFLSPASFARTLERHEVTALFLTTAVFNQYVSQIPEALGRLRLLLCGGERCDPASVARLLERGGPRHLINGYGPTETTTFATTHEITTVPPGAAGIPIGRPIGNTSVYILDANLRPAPIGVAGELYIGGEGVARGYLNRPALTEERFRPDPFSPDPQARMYRTGDLGRWLDDGTIEFLGRNDFQVKIRGFRIELGEIETILAAYPGVSEAVVIARDDGQGNRWLAAYYTGAEDREIGAEALRAHLSARLPEYMVPAAYVRLETLPLTPNGKLDRRALPLPDGTAYVARDYEPPVDEVETGLARIWADLLKLGRVGRRDNFFELGGHSLLATRLIVRIKQEMAVDIGLTDIFKLSELASLAECIVTAQLRQFDANELAQIAKTINISC